MIAVVAVVPATHNPERFVRRWALTIVILAIIAAVAFLAVAVRRWMIDNEQRVDKARIRRLCDAALAELDADDERQWTNFLGRDDMRDLPAWPDERT
jgi:hypothetical protein